MVSPLTAPVPDEGTMGHTEPGASVVSTDLHINIGHFRDLCELTLRKTIIEFSGGPPLGAVWVRGHGGSGL